MSRMSPRSGGVFSIAVVVLVLVVGVVEAAADKDPEVSATPPVGAPFRSLFFVKFHKVGSTTCAVRLGALAVARGWKDSCKVGGENTFCVAHYSMRIPRMMELGGTPIERVRNRFPEPLLVTVLREPVDKFVSWIYYRAWLLHVIPNEQYFTNELATLMNGTAEYTRTLGYDDGTLDVSLALQTLNQFHVVGITQDVSGMFAQVAHHLDVRAEDVKYMSLTTMPNRPRMEDLSVELQAQAYKLLATKYPGEGVIYARAKQIYGELMAKYDLYELRDRIDSLSKSPTEMDCSQNVHERDVSVGGKTCIDPYVEKT